MPTCSCTFLTTAVIRNEANAMNQNTTAAIHPTSHRSDTTSGRPPLNDKSAQLYED